MPKKIAAKKKAPERLPLVTCECGFKMLVIPDLDEMVRCIEAHCIAHETGESDPEKAQAERCRIEELLTQEVLVSIAKKNRVKR
ncbi:MAG: hypothetical protein ACLQO7_12785 [Candidatus Bathyarchaeia archaeon]